MKFKSEKNKMKFSLMKTLIQWPSSLFKNKKHLRCAKATNKLNVAMSYTYLTLAFQIEIVWRFFSFPSKCLGKFAHK